MAGACEIWSADDNRMYRPRSSYKLTGPGKAV